MTAAAQVKRAVVRAIADGGCEAAERYGAQTLAKREAPVCAVGTREVTIARAGQVEYLGRRSDETTQEQREVFGRRMELTLSLDVYAPRTMLCSGCEEAAEQVTQAMLSALPEGLRLKTLRWDETKWDSVSGMFRRSGSAGYEAWFLAEASEEETVFTEFILRGTVKENEQYDP